MHPALLYRDEAGYRAGVGGFVSTALAASEPVLVAVPPSRLEVLRDSLGPLFDGVQSADMTGLGRNPGRILAHLRAFADQHAGRSVRIVGEPIWAGRSPAESTEATRHEALINLAFRGRAATILCPYDVAGLPAAVVAEARRTHPVVTEDGITRPSAAYTDPLLVCADCDTPLPEPVTFRELEYGGGRLAEVRALVQEWAGAVELAQERRADLVLAIGEATANSLAHGGGRGRLRLWTTDGRAVAEIRDAGRLTDPLAGRARPSLTGADGGRGLWMIHQLCDLVETRTVGPGFTIRLHMALGGGPAAG
ncbi:sensor histidine kinase [Kitasatospora sp. NBC_00315]